MGQEGQWGIGWQPFRLLWCLPKWLEVCVVCNVGGLKEISIKRLIMEMLEVHLNIPLSRDILEEVSSSNFYDLVERVLCSNTLPWIYGKVLQQYLSHVLKPVANHHLAVFKGISPPTMQDNLQHQCIVERLKHTLSRIIYHIRPFWVIKTYFEQDNLPHQDILSDKNILWAG